MSYLSIYGQSQNILNPATQYVNGLELYGGFRQFQNLGFYGQLTGGSFFSTPVLAQNTWWTSFPFAPSNLPNFYRDFVSYPALNPGQGYAYGPNIDFARASSATYTGSNGLIQYASIDQPRFDYNPVYLNCNGFLIEEARTNLVLYSEQFDNSNWNKSTVTITANSIVSPDGSQTADTLTSTGVNGYVNEVFSLTPNAVYTGSIWLKSASPITINISVYDTDGTNLDYSSLSCNVTNSWKRFSVSKTIRSTATGVGFIIGGFNTFQTGSVVYAWGAQLELGTFSTSYIPTTSATATRAADVAQVTGSNFQAIYNQDESTFYAKALNPQTGNYNPCMLVAANTTGGPAIYVNSITNKVQVDLASVIGVGTASYNGPIVSVAVGLKAGNYNLAANGVLGTGSSNSTAPYSGQTYLVIGNYTNAQWSINGCLQSIAYFPYRISDGQLASITV
jgi:hypothetical protein